MHGRRHHRPTPRFSGRLSAKAARQQKTARKSNCMVVFDIRCEAQRKTGAAAHRAFRKSHCERKNHNRRIVRPNPDPGLAPRHVHPAPITAGRILNLRGYLVTRDPRFRFAVGDTIRFVVGSPPWRDHPKLHDEPGRVVALHENGASLDLDFGGDLVFRCIAADMCEPA